MPVRRRADLLATAGLVGCGALFIGVAIPIAGARAGLLLAAALVAAFVLYLLAWPEGGVVLGIFLLYSGAPAVLVNDHGLPQVLVLAVPLMFALPLATKLIRREGFVINTALRWLLFLVVVQILVTLHAEFRDVAAARLATFLIEGVVVYFLVVNVIRTPESLRRAMWALIAAGAFLSCVAIVQQITGKADQPFWGFAQLDTAYLRGTEAVIRAQGPVADANYFAQLLLPVVALSLVTVWRGRTRAERTSAAAAAAVCVTAIAFTYSRGGALAMFGILAGLAFFRYLRAVHVVGLVVLFALVVLLVPGYSDRLGTLAGAAGAAEEKTASSTDDFSAAARATENKAALLVFHDHPLLGVGQGGFELVYQDYARRVGGVIHTRNSSSARRADLNAGLAPRREAHNFFLEIAANMGILALLGYCAIVVVTLHQLLRARRKWVAVRPDLECMATGMLLGVIGYMIAAVFLTLAFERYFWLLLAVAGGAGRALLQHADDSDPDRPRRARPAT
jgi:putative inorganic carbon (HCO3(-)) transporter